MRYKIGDVVTYLTDGRPAIVMPTSHRRTIAGRVTLMSVPTGYLLVAPTSALELQYRPQEN